MIHKAQSIGDLLADFIRGTEAETTLLERKIPHVWSDLMGNVVGQFTGEMEVKNGIFYVHIHSAALRQQLFEQRHQIIKKLNDKVGSTVIKDIRLLG